MRILAIAALVIPFAAASAQPDARQLEEVRQPIGKTVKLYRSVERPACGPAQVHHQAGKSPVFVGSSGATCEDSRIELSTNERR